MGRRMETFSAGVRWVEPLTTPFPVADNLAISEQQTWIIPSIKGVKQKTSEPAQVKKGEYLTLMRDLVKSSGIYSLASMVTSLIALILAPFLTRSLTATDYGALTVLTTVIALTAGITQFGLNSSFFRTYSCDYETKRDRRDTVATTTVLLLFSSFFLLMPIWFFAQPLAQLLLNDGAFAGDVRLAALVIVLQNLAVPGLAWLRAESRAVPYSIYSIANFGINLIATIVLVGRLHMGIEGALIASGSGYGLVVLCTMPGILLRVGLRWRRDVSWSLLSFGLPQVTNFISVWVLQLSDRYLLGHLASLAQTAGYAVSYSLTSVLGVVVITPFFLAWPTVMYTFAKRKDAARVFQVVFRWYSLILLLMTFGASHLCVTVLYLFFPVSYHAQGAIIPIVIVSIMFYGIYNFLTTGISVRRLTWLAVLLTTLAALLNIGVNLWLIPLYGTIGAALATLIAYALLMVAAYGVNQFIYPLPLEVGRFTLALIIGIALYQLSDLLAAGRNIEEAWGIYLLILAVYALCLAILGIWPVRDFLKNNKVFFARS